MAELPTKEERALKEFGRRFRAGFAKKHPISQQSLDTVRKAVREQCAKERSAKQKPPPASPNPAPEEGPDGPEP
jgi:hypothetical protein